MPTLFTPAALRTELQLAKYATWVTNQDRAAIMASINAIDQAIQIKRADVSAQEVLEAIDLRDLAYPAAGTLPAASQPIANSWFESITQRDAIRLQKDDGNDTTVLKNLKLLVVSSGQGSQARINALATRSGSRSEQLFGAGYVVSEQNVADALA